MSSPKLFQLPAPFIFLKHPRYVVQKSRSCWKQATNWSLHERRPENQGANRGSLVVELSLGNLKYVMMFSCVPSNVASGLTSYPSPPTRRGPEKSKSGVPNKALTVLRARKVWEIPLKGIVWIRTKTNSSRSSQHWPEIE